MPAISKQPAKKKTKKRKSSKHVDVLSRIQDISKVTNKGLKFSLFGHSGTGKTTLACDFPKPLLLIGAEDGTKSVRNVKGVSFVELKHSTEIVELVDYAKDNGYKSVVLDTATSLQAMTLAEILGLDELPPQGSWGMATRDQYGQSSLQTRELIKRLLDLTDEGIHAVILAQERAFDDESDDGELKPYVTSSLTKGVVGWMNPNCDYLVQSFIRTQTKTKEGKVKIKTKTGKMEYCLRIGPHEIYQIKFRKPKETVLPPVLVDPTFQKISKLIGG